MGMNNIATSETRDFLLQVFAQNQFELRIFLVGLKESILS